MGGGRRGGTWRKPGELSVCIPGPLPVTEHEKEDRSYAQKLSDCSAVLRQLLLG